MLFRASLFGVFWRQGNSFGCFEGFALECSGPCGLLFWWFVGSLSGLLSTPLIDAVGLVFCLRCGDCSEGFRGGLLVVLVVEGSAESLF